MGRMFSFHLHEGWKRKGFSVSSNSRDAKGMEALKPRSVHGAHTPS